LASALEMSADKGDNPFAQPLFFVLAFVLGLLGGLAGAASSAAERSSGVAGLVVSPPAAFSPPEPSPQRNALLALLAWDVS